MDGRDRRQGWTPKGQRWQWVTYGSRSGDSSECGSKGWTAGIDAQRSEMAVVTYGSRSGDSSECGSKGWTAGVGWTGWNGGMGARLGVGEASEVFVKVR